MVKFKNKEFIYCKDNSCYNSTWYNGKFG